jgi:hypothetical protein
VERLDDRGAGQLNGESILDMSYNVKLICSYTPVRHATEGVNEPMPTLYTKLKTRYGPKDRKPGATGPVTGLAVNRPPLLSERLARRPEALIKKRVAIVGAGFAGLAAAYELFHCGYDVIIFEARKRLGGRVFSLNDLVSDKNVEGGGELIGSNHPTWVAYRKNFSLEFLNVNDGRNAPIVLRGKQLTEKESKDLSLEMDRAIDAINADARKIHDPFQPWAEPDAPGFDSVSLASQIQKLQVSKNCKLALAAQLSNDNGVSAADQN